MTNHDKLCLLIAKGFHKLDTPIEELQDLGAPDRFIQAIKDLRRVDKVIKEEVFKLVTGEGE
jgi:hypothetical protein